MNPMEVAFSPFDKRLATAFAHNFGLSGPGNLQTSTTSIPTPSGIYSIAWSESNPNIIACGCANGSILLTDITNAIQLNQQNKWKHSREVWSVRWSHLLAELLVTSSWDCSWNVWNVNGIQVGRLQSGGYCYAAEWSPHIPFVVACCGNDGLLNIWDIREGKCRQRIDVGPALTLDWNKYKDGVVAVGGLDGCVGQVDLRNNRIVRHRIHEKAIRKLKYSPWSADVIATASYDMSVRVSKGGQVVKKSEFKEFAVGVDWSLHEKGMLAMCSWDKSIQVETVNLF